MLFFVADSDAVTSAALAALRNRLGRELELYDPREIHCAWVNRRCDEVWVVQG